MASASIPRFGIALANGMATGLIRTALFCWGFVLAVLFSNQLVASPWVNTDDRYLKTSIKLLADAGYLNIPINTYPLMWQPILAELANADTAHMDQAELFAFLRVTSALNAVRTNHIENLSISAASDKLLPIGFGSAYGERAKLSVGSELKGDNWALGVQKSFYHDAFSVTDYALHADVIDYSQSHDWQGSYAAYTLGNWVLSASQQPQWWGPGYDSSFHFSGNLSSYGPAAKILRINRLNSAAPLSDALSVLGPVNMTFEYGQQPGSAVLRHHKFTAARVSLKPWQSVELAASVSNHQRLSDMQQQRLGVFTDYVLTDTAFTDAASSNESQTITNFDIRYRYNKQTAIYAALTHVGDENGYLIGSEYNIANSQNQLGFSIEYQWLADDYPYWLINANAKLSPTKQLLLAMQWYQHDGTAGYVHFKQQRFAEAATIKVSSAIQAGFQQELFKGLISIDYQLARQETTGLSSISGVAGMVNKINFNHEAGIRWQWRW